MKVSKEDIELVIRWRESKGSDRFLSQYMMWMEESNEYLTELAKMETEASNPDAAAEELADTIIMLWHLAYLFGYDNVNFRVEELTRVKRGGRTDALLPIFELSTGISQFNRGRLPESELAERVAECIVACMSSVDRFGVAVVGKHFSKKLDALMRKVRSSLEAA